MKPRYIVKKYEHTTNINILVKYKCNYDHISNLYFSSRCYRRTIITLAFCDYTFHYQMGFIFLSAGQTLLNNIDNLLYMVQRFYFNFF